MGGQPFVGQVGWMNPITGDEGNLTIDQIQSPGFISGTQGWQIRKDGGAEFNDVIARGTLQSANFVAGVSGWQINNNGTAEFNDLTARGSLHIVNGTSDILLENDIFGGLPAMSLNPDTVNDVAAILAANANGTTPNLQISSPLSIGAPGANSADLFLTAGTTAAKSLASINADNFEVFGGFAFQGAAGISQSTGSSAAVAPGVSTTVLSTSIGATAGCTYKITAFWGALLVGGPVAFPGNRANLQIKRNGTQIASVSIRAQNSTIGQEPGCIVITDTPGAVTATYDFVLSHDAASTAGTFQVQAAANQQMCLIVEGLKANI